MTYSHSLELHHDHRKFSFKITHLMGYTMKQGFGVKRIALRSLAWGGVFASLFSFVAHAEVTAKDVQVAGRVLSFANPPITGTVKLGIVYDPTNAASTADEQALLGILGSGLEVTGTKLIPVPISISNIATSQFDVIFLTSGLGAAAASVGTQAAAKKVLCITTDLSVTQAGSCAVTVQTEPKVEITVNKSTLNASDISFSSAFILMITEI